MVLRNRSAFDARIPSRAVGPTFIDWWRTRTAMGWCYAPWHQGYIWVSQAEWRKHTFQICCETMSPLHISPQLHNMSQRPDTAYLTQTGQDENSASARFWLFMGYCRFIHHTLSSVQIGLLPRLDNISRGGQWEVAKAEIQCHIYLDIKAWYMSTQKNCHCLRECTPPLPCWLV
jgi:hypothetical protein